MKKLNWEVWTKKEMKEVKNIETIILNAGVDIDDNSAKILAETVYIKQKETVDEMKEASGKLIKSIKEKLDRIDALEAEAKEAGEIFNSTFTYSIKLEKEVYEQAARIKELEDKIKKLKNKRK